MDYQHGHGVTITANMYRMTSSLKTLFISYYLICSLSYFTDIRVIQGAAIRHDCPPQTYYDEGTEMPRSCHVICDPNEETRRTSVECELNCEEFYRCINGLPAPVIAPVNTRKSETNSSNRLMGLTQPKTEIRNPSVSHEQNPAPVADVADASDAAAVVDGDVTNERALASSCTNCSIYKWSSYILYALAAMVTIMMTVLVLLLRRERKKNAASSVKRGRSRDHPSASATDQQTGDSTENDTMISL